MDAHTEKLYKVKCSIQSFAFNYFVKIIFEYKNGAASLNYRNCSLGNFKRIYQNYLELQ